jgi:hypothetical protein
MAITQFPRSTSTDPIKIAERMERLRADARAIALEHATEMLLAFQEASLLARQVASGGEAYHVGVREVARRTASDLEATVRSLRSIIERAP